MPLFLSILAGLLLAVMAALEGYAWYVVLTIFVGTPIMLVGIFMIFAILWVLLIAYLGRA